MYRKSLIFAGILTAAMLTACDDGLIYEKTREVSGSGFCVKMTGEIHGSDKWADGYHIVLAGFSDESSFAKVQKQLPADADGKVELTLNNVSKSVTTIKLCVTDILRDSIVGFRSIEVDNPGDTLHFDVGTVDVGMYTAIQEHVFNPRCAQCHGRSNQTAANLNLTDGVSHASLVNQPATHTDGIRVIPGASAESALHKVISPGNEAQLNFSHENMIDRSALLRLIDDWIDFGANE